MTQLNLAVPVVVVASNSIRSVEQMSTLVVVDISPPTTPTGIIATNITTSSARLKWDAATDNAEVVAYQVWYYSKINHFPGHWKRKTGGVTTNREFRVQLSPDPRYTPKFSVSALDASGNESFRGASVSVVVLKPPVLYHPASAGEATVGEPFAYDVNATGNPIPTFDLTVALPGMTVDVVSGLVAWLPAPADIGEITATVRATNSVGFDDHTFAFPVRMPQLATSIGSLGPGMSLGCSGLNSNWSCTVEHKRHLMDTNWVPLVPQDQWPRPVSDFPYTLPTNIPGFFRLKAVFVPPEG